VSESVVLLVLVVVVLVLSSVVMYSDASLPNRSPSQAGRDLKTLKKFASELKPVCSPSNPDLCEKDARAHIEVIQAMTDAELTAKIAELETKQTDAVDTFAKELEKLQALYKKLTDDKETAIAEVAAAGLPLYKAVQAYKAKPTEAKEEL
jgi:uncharacterized coiled-coil protein SlyX